MKTGPSSESTWICPGAKLILDTTSDSWAVAVLYQLRSELDSNTKSVPLESPKLYNKIEFLD